jgi:hypothetical protein
MCDAAMPRRYTLQPSADILDMSVMSSEGGPEAGGPGPRGGGDETPRLVRPRERARRGRTRAGCQGRPAGSVWGSIGACLAPRPLRSCCLPSNTAHLPSSPKPGLDGVVSQKYDAVPAAAAAAGGAPTAAAGTPVAAAAAAGGPGGPGGGPAIDATYRALTRKRTLASLQKGRSVSVITDGRAAQRLYQQQHNRASLYVKQTLADKEEFEARSARELALKGPSRRARMERPELEQLLFRMFERQPHWALPALQKETDQPGAWLREVLGDIALQVKRGPHKDLWELQKQFKVGGGGGAANGAGDG